MAGKYYQIPLTNIPQFFEITLAGVVYSLTVKWNAIGEFWILDIADSNNVSIVAGLPLVVGDDLLDGLGYLGIGGQLFILDNNGNAPLEMPTLDNLGADSKLYFFTSNPNE